MNISLIMRLIITLIVFQCARSEFLLPTFVSPAQRRLIWAFACTTMCFGVFVGIVFILVVQGWSGSNGDDAPAEDEAPVSLPSNASDNCTLTYDPDDISELMREAYVRNFFNLTCIATNGTGDPCDVHLAEEYTYRMFSALRFDRLVVEFLAVVAVFSLAQIGGIPRPTDWNGLFFWLAWMATMLAQYVVVLCALILQVFSFLGVRARLSPCLIQVDGTTLLDFYAMCTFAVQPELIVKAVVLFVYAFLLSLGMLVFDGSRRWQWPWNFPLYYYSASHECDLVTLTLIQSRTRIPNHPSWARRVFARTSKNASADFHPSLSLILTATESEPGSDAPESTNWCSARVNKMHAAIEAAIARMKNKFALGFPRAAWFLQSPSISKAEFVKDATEPTMPKAKRFKTIVPLALWFYHLARTIVLGASFSMWAALGSPAAAPGVVAAWVLAFFVAVLASVVVPWKRVDGKVAMLERVRFGGFSCCKHPRAVTLPSVPHPLLPALVRIGHPSPQRLLHTRGPARLLPRWPSLGAHRPKCSRRRIASVGQCTGLQVLQVDRHPRWAHAHLPFMDQVDIHLHICGLCARSAAGRGPCLHGHELCNAGGGALVLLGATGSRPSCIAHRLGEISITHSRRVCKRNRRGIGSGGRTHRRVELGVGFAHGVAVAWCGNRPMLLLTGQRASRALCLCEGHGRSLSQLLGQHVCSGSRIYAAPCAVAGEDCRRLLALCPNRVHLYCLANG